MIRLFSGRENLDKEKFIYNHIEKETIVIVPDQYTVIAEEQALKYTGSECLFDIEILGMNRLGLRILRENGIENMEVLNKYGRYLLLTQIIKDKTDEFDIFRVNASKSVFVSMMNDFISDCKRQNVSSKDLHLLMEDKGIDDLLRTKLKEIIEIYEEYEKRIIGKYNDNEDYISKYIELISKSKFIKDKNIWIYGFDSISPKFLTAMIELAKYSRGVNIIINESDFGLNEIMFKMINNAAFQNGIDCIFEKIGDEYAFEKSKDIIRIEKDLFKDDAHYSDGEYEYDGNVTIVEAANPYYEAENAAAFITHLIRDEGYRLRDIAVIANEENEMHSIVKRTFSEYGLNVFSDGRRKITENPVVIFVISLLRCVNGGINTRDLINLIKSKLTDISYDDVLLMDSYTRKYHIKGNMWRKAFKYGEFEYKERFKDIEKIREYLYDRIKKLENIIKNSICVKDFVNEFIKYMDDEWNLSSNVKDMVKNLEEGDNLSSAQMVMGSYEAVIDILEQIAVIMGADKIDIDTILNLFEAGIVEVEIATIPTARDQISMGTLIRTRPGYLKTVVILGANEGILPLSSEQLGLFSIDEKNYFREKEFEFGNLDDVKQLEENVALYRMLSKPEKKLYISYSLSDISGNDRKASSFVTDIEDLFNIRPEKDIVTKGYGLPLINKSYESLRHTVNYINSITNEESKSKERDAVSSAVIKWYEENDPEAAVSVRNVASFDNKMKNLDRELALDLYSRRNRDIVLSASKMERFRHCPFRYFVLYGIKPKEEREFTSDKRDIGNVFHECIMEVSKKIIQEKDRIKDEEDLNIGELIHEELSRISATHRGGLFISQVSEEYRLKRVEKLCVEAIRGVIDQLISDDVSTAFFEEPFSKGSSAKYKPIKLEIGDQTVYVEGKIDRIDYLNNNGVRIVDYKTNNEKVSIENMRNGYKMQLMVYLESVMDDKHQPVGVFYFNIHDKLANLSDKTKDNESDELKKNKERFILRGLYIDEGGKEKPYMESKGVSLEDFEGIRKDVRSAMKEISKGITDGDISIAPVVMKDNKECRYCEYRAICRFDTQYEGNRYRYI